MICVPVDSTPGLRVLPERCYRNTRGGGIVAMTAPVTVYMVRAVGLQM